MQSTFKDSNGYAHRLHAGFRDEVVPSWRAMFDNDFETLEASPSVVENAREAVAQAKVFVESHGILVKGARALEVGCYGGAHALALAEAGAASVQGIDIPEYDLREVPDVEIDDDSLTAQSNKLTRLRSQYAALYGSDLAERVSYRDMDVDALDEKEGFDLVVSWQTLEHLTDPARAFENMYAALEPGGACFHEYNPFFCMTGGHSLCTLDFPYGQARLSQDDFMRYIEEIRPAEKELAHRFYLESLNRMHIADLRMYAAEVGFEITSVVPWTNRKDLLAITPECLSQVKTNYPGTTSVDLCSRSVWVLLRKPEQ